MKEYIWMDVSKNKLIIASFDLATVVQEMLLGNPIPKVKKIEISEDWENGRLIGLDDSICEFIGEL